MDFWHHKDEENIKKYRHFILLDVMDFEDLGKEDNLVEKVGKVIVASNEDEVFQSYLTNEEDQKLMHNSEISYAREEGLKEGEKNKQFEIARKMLSKNKLIEEIIEFMELT